MSFDLYAPAQPPRRPPNVYRLLWEKRQDGNWYADAWNDKVFHNMWTYDYRLLQEIGFSYVGGGGPRAIRWNPTAAPKSRVAAVMDELNAKHAAFLAERQRIDEGHRQRAVKRNAKREAAAASARAAHEKRAQLAAAMADRRAP